MAENKHTKRRSDPLEWVKQKAAEVAAKAEQKAAETPRQMFLPGMDEFMRAMPNHIARSSLFAPVARGRRKLHDGTILPHDTDQTPSYSRRGYISQQSNGGSRSAKTQVPRSNHALDERYRPDAEHEEPIRP